MSAVPSLPAVPDPSEVRLPELYTKAQGALEACIKVDECKAWSDRAAALAAYAKMANEDPLRVLSLKIQARAQRRMGELLKEIPTQPGTRTDLQPGVGAHPRFIDSPQTRKQAATEAGLSPHQARQAARVASIPADSFEELVETDDPPSVTELARHGTRPTLRVVETPKQAILPELEAPPLQWVVRLHELADTARRNSAEVLLSTPHDKAQVIADAEAVMTLVTDLYSQLALT